MLIHVTRFTSVQKEVHRQVEGRVRLLRQRLTRRIGAERTIARLKSLWERDFERVTGGAVEADPDAIPGNGSRWQDVELLLPDVVSDIVVKTIPVTSPVDGDVAPEDANRTEPHALVQRHARGNGCTLPDKAGARTESRGREGLHRGSWQTGGRSGTPARRAVGPMEGIPVERCRGVLRPWTSCRSTGRTPWRTR